MLFLRAYQRSHERLIVVIFDLVGRHHTSGRVENEIKNDLVIFWVLKDGKIDGWIARLTLC